MLPLGLALPTLTGWIAQAVAGLAGFFSLYVSKKLAVMGAFTVAFVGGWVALQAFAYATWQALGWTSPAFMREEVFPVVLTLLPDMWLPAVNAIVVMRLARWLWDVQKAWMVTAGLV